MKKSRNRHKTPAANRKETTNLAILLVGVGNVALNTVRFLWTFFHHGS
jgi:hypothetical protein